MNLNAQTLDWVLINTLVDIIISSLIRVKQPSRLEILEKQHSLQLQNVNLHVFKFSSVKK